MITMILCGFGLLVVIAVLVGIEDAAHAQRRRILAAERRRRWEARRLSDHNPLLNSEDDADEGW